MKSFQKRMKITFFLSAFLLTLVVVAQETPASERRCCLEYKLSGKILGTCKPVLKDLSRCEEIVRAVQKLQADAEAIRLMKARQEQALYILGILSVGALVYLTLRHRNRAQAKKRNLRSKSSQNNLGGYE